MMRNSYCVLRIPCCVLLPALVLLLVGCATPDNFITPPVLTPTLTSSVNCADLDAAWATADWPVALQVLNRLEAAGLTCGEGALATKQYAVHINYGVTLEQTNEVQAAIEQYRAALAVNGRGREALDALVRLNALPAPTPPACQPGELAAYIPPAPWTDTFVTIQGNQLVENGQPFFVRGVNYYPRHAPWEHFLTEGNLAEMSQELDLIASAGFNTLRIFLWYDSLFTCAPELARPAPNTFAKLDAFIALAHERDLRLIITLHDLPDLFFHPLYTDWARYDAQTAFIVNRYRNEPAVLAWDLRNEGDLDYGAQASGVRRFERETVLTWLTHAAEIVRANDERHLVTAGWWGDAIETADTVNVLSFHHWASAPELVARIEALETKTTKPILLGEVGYSSWGGNDETSQAQMLGDAIDAAERSGIAGWLIWTAFDFTSTAEQMANQEYHFGLWRVDLTAKPALDVLPITPTPLP